MTIKVCHITYMYVYMNSFLYVSPMLSVTVKMSIEASDIVDVVIVLMDIL